MAASTCGVRPRDLGNHQANRNLHHVVKIKHRFPHSTSVQTPYCPVLPRHNAYCIFYCYRPPRFIFKAHNLTQFTTSRGNKQTILRKKKSINQSNDQVVQWKTKAAFCLSAIQLAPFFKNIICYCGGFTLRYRQARLHHQNRHAAHHHRQTPASSAFVLGTAGCIWGWQRTPQTLPTLPPK